MTARHTFTDWLRIQRELMSEELKLTTIATDFAAGRATAAELDEADARVRRLRADAESTYEKAMDNLRSSR